MAPKPEWPARPHLQALMDSPLYWTMSLKDRLTLVRKMNSRADGCAILREKILFWIKSGS